MLHIQMQVLKWHNLCYKSNKEHPLMEVHGGDFVICDDGLYESFVEFKKTVDYESQTNSPDGGVYAIAFATSLCFCEDISSIQYCVRKMRTHLVSCLEKRQMAPFPSIQRKSTLSHSILAQQLIPVSCSCRMPPAGRMIQCSHCKEQFHKKCERVTRNELSSSWQCRLCAKK